MVRSEILEKLQNIRSFSNVQFDHRQHLKKKNHNKMATPVQRIPYSAPREEFINALKKDGCVIVQNFTTLETLEQARVEVEPYLNRDDNSQVGGEQAHTSITENKNRDSRE